MQPDILTFALLEILFLTSIRIIISKNNIVFNSYLEFIMTTGLECVILHRNALSQKQAGASVSQSLLHECRATTAIQRFARASFSSHVSSQTPRAEPHSTSHSLKLQKHV